MKVSLVWVKEYTQVSTTNDKLVEKIGAQLGAVEDAINLSEVYQGIVIVKVVDCYKHPNADKLHTCLIDDGKVTKNVKRDKDGLVQVVCGAPNIRKGQLVAWIPPGSVMPATHSTTESLTINTREVRGVISNGMIASEQELGLGNNHSGIMIVKDDIKPGTALAKHFQLDDLIVTIENKMFTHRPDCFGILGIAREVAGIQNQAFKSPDWYKNPKLPTNVQNTTLPLALKNELKDLCPRFMAVAMSDVVIKPSPAKLQAYLTRLGIRPINNVVDISNYIMLLTGQPMHLYDYDKVLAQDEDAKKATLATRHPEGGEELTLLNGKTIKPHKKAMLITTQTKAIGLAGVMGGEDTEVSDTTKNIILECATFDLYSIRKTSMTHGIFTDAVTRYSKGQSPLQGPSVLSQTITMLEQLAGAKVASPIIDDSHVEDTWLVTVDVDFINERLGSNLSANEIAKLLKNVEFDVKIDGKKLIIRVPFWRMDIEIGEDIVEEVGRLYGYDKLPQTLPVCSLEPAPKDPILELKAKIRQILSAAGANEALTYSFVHGDMLTKAGQDSAKAFALSNALSLDLQYYRLSLTPSLLEKIHPNIKAGFKKFAMFEMGKAHIKGWQDERKLPKEEPRLSFIYADANKIGVAYYWTLNYLRQVIESLGIDADISEIPAKAKLAVNEQLGAPFAKERSAIITEKVSGELLGVVGEFQPKIAKAFKLPSFCAGFEVDLNALLKHQSKLSDYRPLSKYPKVEQDITLKVDASLSYAKLTDGLANVLFDKTKGQSVELTVVDIYQPPGDKRNKHVTWRISINSYSETFKADDVNELLNDVAKSLKKKFAVTRL